MKFNNLNKELLKIGNDVKDALQQQLGKEGLGNSDLLNDINIKFNNGKISIHIPGYGEFVDKGTKPHTPPISALIPWAKSHNLNPWSVQAKITKWGTDPQPFLFKIGETTIKEEGKLADAGMIDIMKPIDKSFKDSGATVK